MNGQLIRGYEVSFAAAGCEPEIYLSLAEARAALRSAGGGGTITTKLA